MKKADLKNMSVPELVQLFTNLGLKQFQAELRSEQKKLNSAMLEMFDVAEELKIRPEDQRSKLLTLYNHPNLQVRLMAAKLTLAIAPAAARELLQTIADSKEYPQAMDAGMSLWALDKGIFKPT
jgi:Domain of unknown function (DUF2019)